MANLLASARIADIKKKNRIDAEDVLMLRREVFGDGVVTEEEVGACLTSVRVARPKCGMA